jgi:hypothetical protein
MSNKKYNKIRMKIRKKINENNTYELNVLKNEYFKNVKDIKNEHIIEFNEEYNNKFNNLKRQQKEHYDIKFKELYNKQKNIDTEDDLNAFVESCFC